MSAHARLVRRLALEPLEDRTVPTVIGQLRIVDYNILQLPNTSAMTTVLQAINAETRAGLVRNIDIIILQEVNSAGTDDDGIRDILNAAPGSSGQYVTGPLGGTDGTIRPGIVYNDATVDFLGSQIIASSGPRDPIRYQFRPQGLDSTYDFYIYNSHYDAVDAPDRLNEAQNIRANADALGQGAEILYAGDYNIDSSTEGMYTTLLGAGNGQAFDPLNAPGTWHESSALRFTHTQAPGPNFIAGGMDDRFDFILHSQEVGASGTAGDGTGLEYRAGSYGAFGNNGTHPLNGDINQGTGASSTVLTALMAASDHLPVVSDYDIVSPTATPTVTFTVASQSGAESVGTLTVTAQLSATSASTVTVPFTVSGTATGGGVDYSITASPISIPAGSLTGTATITVVNDALDEANETVVLTMGSPTNATPGATTVHTATITDDDAAPTVQFAVTSSSAAESVATRQVTVQLSAASGQTVTVPYTVNVSSTASNPADYTISPASPLTIAAGATSATATITVVNDTAAESSETVVLNLGTPTNATLGANTAHTATITDDDGVSTFRVGSLVGGNSGFTANFLGGTPDAAPLNLYDSPGGTLGAADVVVLASGGDGNFNSGNETRVRGSLVVSGSSVTFVAARGGSAVAPVGGDGDAVVEAGDGAVLVNDTYQVTLVSGASAFTSGANLLDGNGNGTAGDNFVGTFVVNRAANARVLSVPDFARGPGQAVNVPHDGTGTVGIPVWLSDGTSVRSAQFDLLYDSTLLSITGATTPLTGFSVARTAIAGGTRFTVTSTQAAPAGAVELVTIQASVPTANASANYGKKQVLDLVDATLSVTDAGGAALATVADDGVHGVVYLGDVSGNGVLNATDATQVATLAGVGTANPEVGFAGAQNLDPFLVADASGNGVVNATDASQVSAAAGNPGAGTATVPAITAGLVSNPTGAPDPVIFIGTAFAQDGKPADLGALVPGQAVTLPLSVFVTEPAGVSIARATAVFRFDPGLFTFGGVRAGAIASGALGGSPFQISWREVSPGVVVIEGSGPRGPDLAFGQTETLFLVSLKVRRDAKPTTSALDLAAGAGSAKTALVDNLGRQLLLAPAPTDANTDDVDATVTIAKKGRGHR